MPFITLSHITLSLHLSFYKSLCPGSPLTTSLYASGLYTVRHSIFYQEIRILDTIKLPLLVVFLVVMICVVLTHSYPHLVSFLSGLELNYTTE